jgi:Domain of unknown function (DUF4129)
VRSGIEPRRRLHRASSFVTLALAGLLTSPVTSAAEADSGKPTREQISAAIAQLRADPNLGTEKKTRVLRRNTTSSSTTSTSGDSPGWLKWIADAFGWLASTARALLWISAIVLVAVLAIWIKRFLESRAGERSRLPKFSAAPTHVRDLDIRPESLPDDIGRAALDLWQRGEHRAAMALLYRGLLSRLAHVHRVPIRDSSTEGDCLALATGHLPAARSAYAGKLIRIWQRAVYGNTEPTLEEVQTLCAGFAAAVAAPAPADTVERAA